MAHRRLLLALSFLVILLASPPADAGLLKKYDFSLALTPFDFKGEDNSTDNSSNPIRITLLTGRADVQGERGGLYGFVAPASGTITEATSIEVINTQDQQGAISRFIRHECTGDDCAIERTFLAPIMTLGANTTFLWYAANAAIKFEGHSDFAISSLVQPPQDLGGDSLRNLTVERSLLMVGPEIHFDGHAMGDAHDIYAYIPNANHTITVSSEANGSAEYQGGRYLFRFHGSPRAVVQSQALIVPFMNTCSATIRPSSGADLRSQFRPEIINVVLQSFGSNQTVVTGDVADGIRSFSPILNGVIFGFGNLTPIIGKKLQDPSDLALIRFDTLELSATDDGLTAAGTSDFLLLGTNGFYTTRTAVAMGPVRVPTLSFVLWFLAIGAIVGGFVLKPVVAAAQVSAFGAIRLIALGFHLLALLIAFLLWDAEIKAFLGTSLITILAGGASGGWQVTGVAAVFEILPFLLASFFFGMPIRFLVNSGLKIGGLKKARGIGKGIGNLAAWGLGAPFIPLFLNGIIEPVVDALKAAFPK